MHDWFSHGPVRGLPEPLVYSVYVSACHSDLYKQARNAALLTSMSISISCGRRGMGLTHAKDENTADPRHDDGGGWCTPN